MKARPASKSPCSVRVLKSRRFIATIASIGMLVFVVMMLRAPFSTAQTSESISTFDSDCETPKIIFNVGDTVCAVATGSLLGSVAEGVPTQRRFQWSAPDGTIFGSGAEITTDPQSDSITLPTGVAAQLGRWVVKTVDSSNNGVAIASFTVQDPANAAVDLWTPISAPFQVSAGSTAPFSVFVTNKGPNAAENVELTVTVATNSTFVSKSQVSGPAFDCTDPTSNAGVSTCTIDSLPANTTAQFTFFYQIDSNAPAGAVISATATVTSDTNELFDVDNTFTASVTIPEGTASTCEVTCPADITTNKEAGQCGATVSFTPSSTGSGCGTITCTPASGSFFPTGTTSVICLGETGGPCVFNVIVEDPEPPTISCPSDVTVDESSPGFGSAVVHFPAPTLNDNCSAGISDCNPPSGSSFPTGITTVVCQTGGPSNTVTCNFTVTVNGEGGGACTVVCPGDITQSASANACSATVTYDAPTTSGICGTVACSPPSGSTFPIGTTVVSCTSAQGPGCNFSVTILASAPPTIVTCATNKTVNVIANCEATIPNLVNEVVATGCSVIVTQSPAAGTLVSPGVYTVTITAENSAGVATCTATVTVTDNFTGFFSPVSNLPALNSVNAGRAIPVKFSLNGDRGLDIFAPGFPASGVIACDTSATPIEITETLTAGGSSLSYDAGSDQYTYVWKTEKSWAGTCRQLVLQLKNGCVYRANFKFK